MPSSRTCNDQQHHISNSPVAKHTNSLLWGAHSAVLVRGVDWYDNPTDREIRLMPRLKIETPLLPASLVHASVRPPNVKFPGAEHANAGVLVGSKLDINNKNNNARVETINVSVCYPWDASSHRRNALNTGQGCCKNGLSGICVNETCLSRVAGNCKCNSSQVPPHAMGDFYSTWVEGNGGKRPGLSKLMCWYDDFHGDTITATNSLWLSRQQWYKFDDSPQKISRLE